MTGINTKFVWPRGQLLELVESPPVLAPGTLARAESELQITQIGSETVTALPLEDSPALYLAFSNLERTPEACLGFARRWGFLSNKAEADKVENVAWWCDEINRMRTSIDNLTTGDAAVPPQGVVVGLAEIRIQPGGSTGLTLGVVPRNLLSALWMQLVQAVTSGAKLLTCDQCGNWFEAGIGHRRVVARFCSTACRDRFHNVKRREKRALKTGG